MSEVAESPAVREAPGGARHARVPGNGQFIGVGVVIVATTALALALRVYYQSALAGFLQGVTEYDDGTYFGSALRLVTGVLPYRDFVSIQPPGITLLMAPAALAARVFGTAAGMELARILTTAASGAGVVLAGLLVRRYGTLAVLITCGIMAIQPENIRAAHTVYVEPWLVLFCLIGALALFDGDQLARGWRLAWAGVAFGFAGAVEGWAIVPALVAILLFLPRLTRAWPFCTGVAAGFLIPVLPFVGLAPRQFYDDIIVAQLEWVSPARTPIWSRLARMIGINQPAPGQETFSLVIAAGVAVVVVGAVAAAWLISRHPPPLLERFVVLTSALIIVMFCLAPQFYYHFVTFLMPFLAASIALPISRLLTGGPAPSPPRASKCPAHQPQPRQPKARRALWFVTGVTAVAIVLAAVLQFRADSLRPGGSGQGLHAVDRIIPPGTCVLTDQVSMTILANRFYSAVPGCPQMVNSIGTDLALSHGRAPSNGAGYVPAVAAVWRQAFSHAQIVLLSQSNEGRIAWTPALRAYFAANFVELKSPWTRVTLYKRKGFDLHAARQANRRR